MSLLIVLLVVALLTDGSSNNNKTPSTPARNARLPHHHTHHTSISPSPSSPAGAQSSVVALSVQPTGPVYVCLISAGGRKLIPGLILQPGSSQPTYHSKSFTITLGNSSVKLFGRMVAAHRAGFQPGDRLLDHQGRWAPHAFLFTAADLQVTSE